MSERLLAPGCVDDQKAVQFEQLCHSLPDVVAVFDDENRTAPRRGVRPVR
jgi:hypothetical protein